MALPGIRTVLKDRFYTIQRTDTAIGPRVLAIGYRSTANGTNGVSDLDPYFATNEQDVITSFGLGSDLHKAFLELASGGAPRIYLVALPAETTDSQLINNTGGIFDAAFDAAESALPDIIVPYGRGANSRDWDDWATPATPGGADKFGFYADNSSNGTTSMAKLVADKVQVISDRSNPCFAVMGVKPYVAYEQGGLGGLNSGKMITSQVATHLAFPNLYDHNLVGNTNGSYLTVVAAELRPVGFPIEFGWANGAATYAGMVSQIDPWISTTGRITPQVELIRYAPNRTQQEALIDKGLVPLALDYTRAPTWVDGRTFGRDVSDYVRITTLRIIQATTAMIRQVARPFIGKPASLENRNGLETAITSGLRNLQLLGALLGSDFVVTYIPRENRAEIDLVLQPAFEIRNIDISVSVQL